MLLKRPTYAWYAVYTKVNQEKKVYAALQENNIECYLPVQKTLRQWSDRKKWIEVPVFRCYIFVKVSYIDFFKVLSTPGVIFYVSFSGKAQKIPDNQIDNIRTLIKHAEKEVVITKKHIAKGIKAEVIFGKLKGLRGEVVKICGQSRIVIRIESLKCCLYAQISKDEIKILKETAKRPTKKPFKKKTTSNIKDTKITQTHYRQQIIVNA